jgi:hypothetical protein
MASRTIIDASAGGSIIELTPTQAFTLFKKVADNDTWASSGRLHPIQPTGNVKGVLQVEKEDILEGKIDSLVRRLEKMEMEKKEAQDLKAVEERSTCQECGEYGHVHKDCPEEAKVLDYMRKGDLPNFRYGQGRPQFNASSSIPQFKIMGATIYVGKGEIMFDINGERSSFKFRPRLDACNMIEVKNVHPHGCVVKEEPSEKEGLKKKREPKKKDVKKIKEVVASVKAKEEKPPVKTKK